MSPYIVYITPSAWDEVRDLPGHIRQRVRHAIAALANDPRPVESKALVHPIQALASRLNATPPGKADIATTVGLAYSLFPTPSTTPLTPSMKAHSEQISLLAYSADSAALN